MFQTLLSLKKKLFQIKTISLIAPWREQEVICLIAILDKKNCIGRRNQLLFKLSKDLQRFKALTLHKPIIMGRATYESLNKRPLPRRTNIIVSTTLQDNIPDFKVCPSLEEAFAYAREDLRQRGRGSEIMVIGGGKIYAATICQANRLLLTHVDAIAKGDTYFPKYKKSEWKKTDPDEPFEEDGLSGVFRNLERVA